MKWILALGLIVSLSRTAIAGPFVSEQAKDAAFYVLVTLDLQVSDGDQDIVLSTAFSGSSVCISKDGHLLTCRHVADPLMLIIKLLRENPGNWSAVRRAHVQYRVENRQGWVFYTNYEPDIRLQSSPELESFGIKMRSLESRHDCDDAKRNVRIVGQDKTADVIVLKVAHSSPLPFITFADTLRSSESQVVYAVSARKRKTSYVTTVLRPGFLDTRALGQKTINNSPAHQLLMTTISGDSGSAIVNEDDEIVGMAFANEQAEENDCSYMITAERIFEVAEQCGALTRHGPSYAAPPPPPEPISSMPMTHDGEPYNPFRIP